MGKTDNDDTPILLSRRLSRPRERLIGMTDEERAWRAQYLKDQVLDPDEPVLSPEYYKEKYHLVRRIYRFPMDKFENMLVPSLGRTGAAGVRYSIARTVMGIVFCYFAWYHMKYNKHDWRRYGGWGVRQSRMVQFPSDPGFPTIDTRVNGNQFSVYDFDKSPI